MDSYLTAGDIGPAKAALEFLNRIYNVDKSHMDMAEMRATASDPVSMFQTGNVAMMVNGAWALAQLKSGEDSGAAKINWGMTNLPTPPGVKPKTGVGGISFVGINANTANPAAGWEFVKFLVGPGGAEIYARTGNLPAYVTPEIGQYYIDYYRYEAANLLFDPDLKINAEQGKDPRYAEVLDVFRQNAELYLLKEISIDQFGENFLSDRASILR
jgi:multiple sugar transport system substrate-binding protein